MRYLCLVFRDDARYAVLSAEEVEMVNLETRVCTDELRRNGTIVAALPAEWGEQSTVVRVRGGRLAISDDPYATSGERLTGLYVIDAVDLNDAIRLASRMPLARFGSVDVRPLSNGASALPFLPTDPDRDHRAK
jgi:hypothetical protein